jgi:hypothetical protein
VSVDFLVKLRDAAQLVADAAQEELEKMDPTKPQETYNPENVQWTRTDGTKGPYERYPAFRQQPDTSNKDYNGLMADLKKHDGKLTRAGLFYWLFSDQTTIGRKLSQKKE